MIKKKNESELLEMTKAIAKICGVNIKIENKPSGKGGLKICLTITAKSPKKTAFFFSSRRRHTMSLCDWSSDVCSSDLSHILHLKGIGEVVLGNQREDLLDQGYATHWHYTQQPVAIAPPSVPAEKQVPALAPSGGYVK